MYAKSRKMLKKPRFVSFKSKKRTPNEEKDHSIDPMIRLGFSGSRDPDVIRAEIRISPEEMNRQRLFKTKEAQKFLAHRMLPMIAEHLSVSKIFDLDEREYIMIGEIKIGELK